MKTKVFYKNRMNSYFEFAKSEGNTCIAEPKSEVLPYQTKKIRTVYTKVK